MNKEEEFKKLLDEQLILAGVKQRSLYTESVKEKKVSRDPEVNELLEEQLVLAGIKKRPFYNK